jgi:molybdate transport system substrate-binding protein
MFVVIWLLLAALAIPQAPLTVSAAVSLTEALTEIGALYKVAGGPPVRFNFAASNVLARQIANGAPVDVFISADTAQMDMVQRAGAIDPTTRVDVVGNRLAVVVLGGLNTSVKTVRDLAQPAIRRIALGNPDAVPAGVYARQFLVDAGVWSEIEARIVPTGSVRAALAAVESGSVDAAIVYESDTTHLRSATVAFVVTSGGPKIVYPAALVSRGERRDEGVKFLQFLRNRQSQEILRKHKFEPLAG